MTKIKIQYQKPILPYERVASISWNLIRLVACGSAAALLLCQAVRGQTIPNPSFEANSFTVNPGYISSNTAITGWTGTPTNRVGLNPASGSPFADNGTIPNGNNVAFIQNNPDDPGTPSTLSTTITGLTVGTTYKVTLRMNARNGNTPNLKVYIDGVGALLPGVDGLSTAAVTGTKSYWYLAFEFTATNPSQTLALVNDATGDQTVLVDDLKIAPSSGRWTVSSWTSDGDSGVDSAYLYSHAYRFGGSANTTINGVTFTSVAGGNPAVAGKFSTAYLVNVFLNDVNNLTGGGDGSAVLANAFIYGGPGGNVPADSYQTIALEGLTPGMEYVMTVYSVGFDDPSVTARWATFSMDNDYLTLNQDAFYNNNGIHISYRYTADASGTATMRYAPLVPANVSFHTYGFANREAVSRFVAPTFTTQPRNITVSPDLAVEFSAVAAGVPVPTYQWRFNGTTIADATNATLALPPVTAANAGSYTVVASNMVGMVTSVVARLTVGLPMTNPSFEADTFTVYPGYVSGNGPITGWASMSGDGINPANGSPFADNGVIPNGIQVAFMQADGALSQTVSGLTVGVQYYVHYYENSRTGPIPSLEVKVGGTTIVAVHPVPAVGSGSYYEMSSEAFVATATDMELAFIKSNPTGNDTTALVDSVAILPLAVGTPPTITLQPAPTTVYLGKAASFTGRALGSLPLHYQWRLNGTPVADATSTVLALSSVRLADEGGYTLVVTNSSGAVTSAVARLTLLETIPSIHSTGLDAAGNPIAAGAIDPFWTLTVNPDGGSTNVYVGNEGWPIAAGVWLLNSATSKWVGSRAAVGDPGIPLGDYTYHTTFDLTGRDLNTVLIVGQWLSDNWGTPLRVNGTDVTTPLCNSFNVWAPFTLTRSNATFLPGLNTLDFVVNNIAAGATGVRIEFTQVSARTLPGIAPAIAIPPQGVKVAVGDTVVLGVTATGTLPLAYQWRKNSVDMPGKTDDTLTLTTVTTNDSALYRVAVSNQWGTAVSANAAVSVAYRPLPGIFGTGVGTNGLLLADNVVDPHYLLAASPDVNFPGPDALTVSNVWPIASGVWLLNGPNSRWIGPMADQSVGNTEGDYIYQTTLDLTGYDLSKLTVLGGVAVDNTVTDVLVNGLSSGITAAGFNSLTPFTITSGLVAGVNTLDFKVFNAGTAASPTGLRVDLKVYLSLLSPVTLQITHSGANVSISWSPAVPGQKLQSAPAVTGPWTDITDAPNPYTTAASGAHVFYRVSQ